MLFDLLGAWFAGRRSHSPGRALIFLLLELDDLPLALVGVIFPINQWAEIIGSASFAPFFRAGRGRRTFVKSFFSLRPYRYRALIAYMPCR